MSPIIHIIMFIILMRDQCPVHLLHVVLHHPYWKSVSGQCERYRPCFVVPKFTIISLRQRAEALLSNNLLGLKLN